MIDLKLDVNEKETKGKGSSRSIVFLIIGMAAAVFFYMIWNEYLIIDDDFLNYTNALTGNTYEFAMSSAVAQGRFANFFLTYLAHFAFYANSLVVYKLISYLCISFGAFSIGWVLYRHVNKNLAYLGVLLFFGFAQANGDHSLFNSYILSHQLTMAFMIFSIDQQLTYYKSENRKARNMIISGGLLALCFFSYESFIFFSLLSFAISLYANYHQYKTIKLVKTLLELKYHILFTGAFLLIYIGWRILNPSVYDGNQISSFSIVKILFSTVIYSLGMLPGMYFLREVKALGLSRLLMYFEWGYLILGILIALTSVYLIKNAKKINTQTCIKLMAISCASIFLPNIVLGLTGKYQSWAIDHHVRAYVPSYYSYFAIIILGVCVAAFIYQKLPYKRLISCIYFISICCVVVGTYCSNSRFYHEDYMEKHDKQQAFTQVAQSDYFINEVEDGSTIYVPDNAGINGSLELLNRYTQLYSSKTFNFVNEKSNLTFEQTTYLLKYDKESKSTILAEIDRDFKTTKIVVYSRYGFVNSSIVFRQQQAAEVRYQNTSTMFGDIVILPLQENEQTDNFIIEGDNILTDSVQLINGTKVESNQINSIGDAQNE